MIENSQIENSLWFFRERLIIGRKFFNEKFVNVSFSNSVRSVSLADFDMLDFLWHRLIQIDF